MTGVSQGRHNAIAAAAVIAVSLAAYANTLLNGFFLDDEIQVLGNRWLLEGFSSLPEVFTSGVRGFAGGWESNHYRPLLHVAYMIEHAIFGFEPWGYHFGNVLLNAAVTAMFFLVAKELLVAALKEDVAADSNVTVIALLGALVFALHPARSEAVNWVAAVTELLYTLFGLVALYIHLSLSERGIKWRIAAFAALFFHSFQRRRRRRFWS